MDDDDNGQLLDSDLGYNMRSPKDTRKMKHPTHGCPPPILSPLEPIQDECEDEQTPGNVGFSRPSAALHGEPDDEDNQEQMQMMSRYWRSKSLPAAYFPQFPLTSASTSIDQSECSCGNTHPPEEDNQHHYRRVDSTKSSNSSGYKDSKSKSGKGNKSGTSRGNSCRSRGCSSGGGSNCHSVASGSSTGDNGNSDASNGCNHHILPEPVRCVKKGGGNSGHSGDQESGEVKRRTDWRTLQQHYYPEGGWGWVITFCALFSHALAFGIQLYLSNVVFHRFHTGWLGSVSMGVSLFLSPIWVSICKRKSTRLSAVFGGLVGSLGCLFTSFAFQFHQICISYGAFVGVGVGLTRDASSLMVGQYFKRKRDLVEIFVVSGSGVGILLMSISIHIAISSFGWRLGLQAVTGSLFLTFFLGTCYRSASLYHPQRRAILHLKNQKRKVKDKEKRDEKPPFIDFKCLKSKTLQILLLSCAFTAFGINTPLFHMALECAAEGEDQSSLVLLHIYMGVSWIIGCFLFGIMVIQKNQECRVSKQYLCQMASVICAISIVALSAVEGFGGLVIFAWVYGFSLGGYNYALKVYTYERVRARHFPRAWSFVQCAQAIPLVIGVPLTGHMNASIGWKSGYYLSAFAVFIGSAFLFLTDVRRRRLSRRKTPNSSMKTNETTESVQSPKMRRLSFSFPMEQFAPNSKHDSEGQAGGLDPSMLAKELTCISEEGLADVDFQDIYFEEWAEYFGDCITSCGKVENCLVSEYDPDLAVLVERRARRWSAARPSFAQAAHAGIGTTAAALAGGIVGVHNSSLMPPPHHTHHLAPGQMSPSNSHSNLLGAVGGSPNGGGAGPPESRLHGPGSASLREIPVFRSHGWNTRGGGGNSRGNGGEPPPRTITVIDEASV